MKKKNIIIGFLITTICIYLLIFVTNAFFSNNISSSGDITLKELNFSLFGNVENNTSIMPGDTLNLDCYLINSRDLGGKDYENLANIYIKFNIIVESNNKEVLVDVIEDNDNFISINNEIYYTQKVVPGQVIKFIKAIEFSTNLDNSFSGQNVEFVVTVDAIQATNDAIMELWPEFYNYLTNKNID